MIFNVFVVPQNRQSSSSSSIHWTNMKVWSLQRKTLFFYLLICSWWLKAVWLVSVDCFVLCNKTLLPSNSILSALASSVWSQTTEKTYLPLKNSSSCPWPIAHLYLAISRAYVNDCFLFILQSSISFPCGSIKCVQFVYEYRCISKHNTVPKQR